MDTIECKALRVFTQFIPGYGQIHGNPDAKDAAKVRVPVDAVDTLVLEGKIEEPDSHPVKGAFETGEFTVTPIPGGRYRITGPGMAKPETIKGKVETEVRVAELRDALHADGDLGDGPPTE